MTEVFGADGPLITSTKGITGHALGAAGAIEAVAVVLSMDKGLIPPTAGYTTPDPDMPALDLVTGAPAPWEPGISMSNSFGFGGHNGSVVLAPACPQLPPLGGLRDRSVAFDEDKHEVTPAGFFGTHQSPPSPLTSPCRDPP